MPSDTIWRFVGCLIPLFGSAVQVWATLLKRSTWISQNESSVGRLGRPFTLLDKAPLRLAYFLLVSVLILSLLALSGGIFSLNKQQPPMLLNTLFENSLLLTLVFTALAVLIHLNGIARLMLMISRAFRLWDRDLLYNPGWINAYWHICREEGAVPINTNLGSCRTVSNDFLTNAAIGEANYDVHRATKPVGLSVDELANFLIITNAIEAAAHQLDVGEKIGFQAFYQQLGETAAMPEKLFAPATLIDLDAKNRSLYARLRELIPELPDVVAIDTVVKRLVVSLVNQYSGQAIKLAKGRIRLGFDGDVLKSRLQRLHPFDDSQPMQAQVIKLGIEWNVWPGMQPGPFCYPFSQRVASLLLNLGCLRTRPNEKSIPCDEEFIRLSAWTLDRIVDGVLDLLRNNFDPRVIQFCQRRFGCPPSDVERRVVCREVDYFLWVQSRMKDPDGGIFGERATIPWKVAGNNLVNG